MSIQIKNKIESRQQSNKKITNKNVFSSNTLESINKEHTEKKIYKDLSLNFLKNYSTTSITNKTCVNHNHKKIIIKEKSKLNNNKKFSLNLHNQNKFIKFPLKLNYKQSVSLKNLIEEENLLNPPLRSSDKRKNTNTKIELFSTNSTLSFLNIKDNNKDISKPIKIKCYNNNRSKKKFASTFFERKIKSKSSLKIKIKHIKNNNNLSLNKKNKMNLLKNKKLGLKENIFSNSNKSIEFCSSYMKPINKRRNLSLGLNENSHSNTNSIKEFYNKKINQKNLDYSSNFLYENMSFSLIKNQNNKDLGCRQMFGSGNNLPNKINFNTYYKTSSINNNSKKKISLCSLPNLLCNNYINMHNFTLSKKELFNNKNKKKFKYIKNKSSLFEKKNANYIKINKINNNSIVNKNRNKNNCIEMKEVNCANQYNTNQKLKNIHLGIKSLLDGLYNIYLNANNNGNNAI